MRDKRWIAPTILAIVLVLALVWGYNQYTLSGQLGTALTNNYQRLLFDVKKHVENVQVALSKALVSESKDQNVLLLSQIMNEAYFAQDKLSQMPISHADTAKTEKFLTQVADYSYTLMQNHLKGEELTSKQRETLFNLQKGSAGFNEELSNLHDKLIDSNFNIDVVTGKGKSKLKKANENMLQTSLTSLEKQMGKSPELIYDGPYSDQQLNKKPLALGDKKVTSKEAEKLARNFVGREKVEKVTPFESGKDANTVRIPSYTFSIVPKNASKESAIYIGVSTKGGEIVWMENPRAVSKANISITQAEKRALNFLEEKGYTNMEPNYSLKYDGTILFNFTYKDDDVTVYSDLVKVKVALDNGEIVGFDASTYLMNHQDRNIKEPSITMEEARESVRVDYDIDSTRLALIPKGKNEILCYEFKGKYQGSDFIIYINASNGNEEDVLQIIKNENGTLTF